MSESIDYGELNKTELVAIAAQLNHEAHRGLPREALIAIIEGKNIELPSRVVNKKRLKIMNYINANWVAVEPLISCPATSRDPYACFRCSDFQVTSCTLDNHSKFLADD
jgi:hypothetical protein